MRLHAIHNAMEIKRKDEAAKVAAGKKKYSVTFKKQFWMFRNEKHYDGWMT
jgi:hypothetical protein